MTTRLAILLALTACACTETFATPAPPSPTQKNPSGSSRPIVAGTDCSGRGVVATQSKRPFTRDGTTWKRQQTWGCGCPKGPVFTLVYEPKTSPLRVRLCMDQSQDSCEAACRSVLSWDLAQPLRDAGATDVQFVD